MNDIFQLFQDLTILIDAQGEMLDNIEANMADANDYVESGRKHLD